MHTVEAPCVGAAALADCSGNGKMSFLSFVELFHKLSLLIFLFLFLFLLFFVESSFCDAFLVDPGESQFYFQQVLNMEFDDIRFRIKKAFPFRIIFHYCTFTAVV